VERQEIAMSEHKAQVLLSLSREARGRSFKNDEMRTGTALTFVTRGSARLDPGRDAIQSLDASTPVTGRSLLASDSTQTRSLEGRPLTMYSALTLPDRSRLRLLRAPRAGVTTSPLSSLAREKEGPMRLVTREVEKWKTDRR
jgi:hypothetical protein